MTDPGNIFRNKIAGTGTFDGEASLRASGTIARRGVFGVALAFSFFDFKLKLLSVGGGCETDKAAENCRPDRR
jgi:hypothetical protein